MESRILKHPPLRDAILEILFEIGPADFERAVSNLKEVLISDFPKSVDIFQQQIQVTGGETLTQAPQQKVGVTFSNTTEEVPPTEIISAQTLRFAYSQNNQSYTNWETFFPKAIGHLDRYIKEFEPKIPKRASLRFINQMDFHTPEELIGAHIYINPPMGWSPRISASVVQLNVVDSDQNLTGIVRQIIDSESGQFKMIFDIDVMTNITSFNGDVKGADFSEIFEKLRTYKNEIFFNSFSSEFLNQRFQ